MAWSISADIETALWTAAERHLPRSARGGAALAQAVIARSRRYTSDREQLHEAVPSRAQAADLAARALFFTVTDAAKVMIPLAELDARGLLPAGEPLRILDMGAGVGAMSLGALDYLHREGALAAGREVVIRAVDRDPRALELMATAVAELAARWGAGISLTTECADISHAELAGARRGGQRAGPRADLVLAGTVLNELPEAARRPMIEAMLEAVDERGAVVIIEPALRSTARALHGLRDDVLHSRLAHVFAPCTRQLAPCPALAAEADWCHEDRPTSLPPRAARLTAATGLRSYGLKFAYLVLRKQPEPLVAGAGTDRACLRVVSQPRKSKGKRECYVCSDAGRHELRMLRRHRSPVNADLRNAERGDVLLAPDRLAGGGDVAGDDPITVVRVAVQERRP